MTKRFFKAVFVVFFLASFVCDLSAYSVQDLLVDLDTIKKTNQESLQKIAALSLSKLSLEENLQRETEEKKSLQEKIAMFESHSGELSKFTGKQGADYNAIKSEMGQIGGALGLSRSFGAKEIKDAITALQQDKDSLAQKVQQQLLDISDLRDQVRDLQAQVDNLDSAETLVKDISGSSGQIFNDLSKIDGSAVLVEEAS